MSMRARKRASQKDLLSFYKIHLKNKISLYTSGNEFYFIRLESDPKVAYIYNTKFFEFDEYY